MANVREGACPGCGWMKDHRPNCEVGQALSALERARGEGDARDIADGERWVAQAQHEAGLTEGRRVEVAPRSGRNQRFAGEQGTIVRRDSGRVFLVRGPELDMLVDSRDLRIL